MDLGLKKMAFLGMGRKLENVQDQRLGSEGSEGIKGGY